MRSSDGETGIGDGVAFVDNLHVTTNNNMVVQH